MKSTSSNVFPEVIIIQPQVFSDSRGYFFEGYQQEKYGALGIDAVFVQDNFSHSVKNTLRGLHYQRSHPQGKLVGVLSGSVFDVVVDIRHGSPNFGKWFGTELNAENKTQLYIPPGFAHGFCVLSDEATFYYKCTDFYVPHDDFGILWSDPSLNIQWPVQGEPILSAKDSRYDSLKNIAITNLPRFQS